MATTAGERRGDRETVRCGGQECEGERERGEVWSEWVVASLSGCSVQFSFSSFEAVAASGNSAAETVNE